MEVRPGYKQTELGVIPCDWDVCRLDSLGTGQTPPIKAGPFGSSLTKNTYVPTGFKVYGQEQVIRGDHRYGDYFITPRKYRELEACAVRPGDVLLSLVGTVGKLLAVPEDASPGVINPRLIRFSFDKSRVSPTFFKFLFESQRVQGLLGRQAQGGTMGVLSAGVLRSFCIQLPPLSEQRFIAAALSDIDALLAGLDHLIAKKRDLKQAAMQQLLTGQTRLPGFEAEWEVKRLGDMLTICHGRNQREAEDPGGLYPILATGGQIGTASRALYDKPSVLIGRKGTINQPRFMDTPFWTVDTLFYSALKGDHSAKFLYYRFCLIDWMQYNEASGVPSLNARTIENVEVSAPVPAEQFAIATVLTDMDAEISGLEARRNKTHALKQGMMQELLTGRTRLV